MNRAAFVNALALAKARGVVPKRLPRAAEPLAQQRRYAKRIKRRVLEDAMRLVRAKLVPELERLAESTSKVGHAKPETDAAKTDDLGDILDEISRDYYDKWTRREFVKLVRPVAVEVEMFEAAQLNKQLSAALGEALSIDVVGNEPWLSDAVANFTRENVGLIRSIPEQFFADLEKTLSKEIADGARWEDLAAGVEERYNVSESRAELIARDQVSKFNGDLNRTRQQELGIDRFIWRTMGDERVREEHVDYNGQSYTWEDAPEGGPGEPVQCRCYADPDVLSALE